MTRQDPYAAFDFLVEIDGLTVGGFSECRGLSAEIDVIEYREGGDRGGIRKLPGLTRYSNIVLKRGITASRELWQWFRATATGAADRRTGRIVLLDRDRNPVAAFRFVEGWVARWEGPHLRAAGNDVAIETLEIAHEGLDLE